MGIMNGTQSAGRRWLVGLLMLGMGLALAGCVRLLEPRQSDIQYYVLGTPDANIETMQQHDTTHIALGLRRVRIADYLDSPALVTRRGAHAIRFAEFHRWGEDLARAINRTVAARLVSEDDIGMADVVPFTGRDAHDYLIQLRVLRFEGEGPPPLGPDDDPPEVPPTGSVQMKIAWEILEADAETVAAQGVTRYQANGWTVGDYASLVTKLDASLTALADDLTAQLRQLPLAP